MRGARRASWLGAVLVAVGSWAAPAGAHAELEETSPVAGAVLDDSPAEIELTFTEPVVVSPSSIRVHDSSGDLVGAGLARQREGASDRAVLDLPDLPDGGYVVTWRVLSADSHPVNGAFTFRVGSAGAEPSAALLERLLAAEGGSPVVGGLYFVVRVLAFAAVIALVGGGALLVGLWPAGAGDRDSRRFMQIAWAVAVVTTLAGLAVQGAYGAGLPLSGVLRWPVIESVLGTRFGAAWLVRLGALVATVPLWRAYRRPTGRGGLVVGGLVAAAVALVVTPGVAGHAGATSPAAVMVALDGLHLGGASVWLGGLALLASGLLRHGDAAAASPVLVRFSRLAFWAVLVVLATGLAQGWLQTRSVAAATTTIYGRLVLTKVGLFVVLVVLAAVSRSWVRRRALGGAAGGNAASVPPVSRLRRAVAGELGVAVLLLVATSLLVNAIPGRTAVALPLSTELEAAGVLVEVTIDPAEAGPVEVHLYSLTPAGAVTEVEEMQARFSLPGRDIGELEVPLQRAGPGHFVAYGFDIPIPGEWRLEITVRPGPVVQETVATTVRIR